MSLGNRLNILFIPAWYPHEADYQLGIFIHKHAKAVALHHSVTVIYVLAGDKNKIDKNHVDGIQVVQSTYKSGKFSPLSFLKAYKKAIELLGNFKPDIVHTHVADKCVIAADKYFPNTPKIHTEHWSGFINGAWDKLPFYKRIPLKVALKSYRHITTVSPELLSALDGIFPMVKKTIIPNVIECSKLSTSNYTEGKLKILTVADLTDEVKNISGIIEACCKIPDDFDIEWTIIGDGPDRYFLEALAEQSELNEYRIKFLGRLSNDEVLNLIPNYHLMVSMSHVETFGMAVCEGIAAGIPVFCTPVGVSNELISANSGRIVRTTDELVSQVLKFYRKEITFDHLEVKKSLPKAFTLGEVGKALSDLYTETLTTH